MENIVINTTIQTPTQLLFQPDSYQPFVDAKTGTINPIMINQIPVYVLRTESNIAHFFYGYLYHAIDAFLKDNRTKWAIRNNLLPWETKFTLLCAKYLQVKYEFVDPNFAPISDGGGKDINIKENANYTRIMEFIQTIIKIEFPDINYAAPYKVLYFRNDARRKMVGYNGTIDHYFDKIIYDFASMSFEEQVKLFMQCSHLVTIEGAHLTNTIFMNKQAKVLDICQHINSWQLRYGPADRIKSYEIYAHVDNVNLFNCDTPYSQAIELRILQFLRD